MPELPEVETIAAGLSGPLKGRRIQDVKCHPLCPFNGSARRLRLGLRERDVREVRRHGKHLFLCLSEGFSLAVHLGMSGQLFLADGSRKADRHTHLELIFQAWPRRLLYRDPRRFGRIRLLKGEGEGEAIEGFLREHRLGPDALSARAGQVEPRLRATSRSLKAALLDQTVIAGLGNIYTDEVLFRARLDPRGPAHRLRNVESLLRTIREVLAAAVRSQGTTISDYVDAEGRRGSYQQKLAVYGRPGEPCPACGRPIVKILLAGRSTFFCPSCQKG